MDAKSFKGGTYVPHYKDITDSIEIEKMTIPDRVVIPMHQCYGAASEPIVKVGDRVTVGQKIGDSEEFFSAPVHSSVNGIVEEIEILPYCGGENAKSVIIKVEGEDQEFRSEFKRDPKAMSKEEIIKIVHEAGIVGMGGAAFPTHINIDSKEAVEYLVLNGAECEPFITCDHRVMVDRVDELIAGAEILSSVIGAKKCVIGIGINKPDAIEMLKEKTKNNNLFEIVPLSKKYPQGFKSLMIKSTTGRDVRRGARSAEIGCIVRNVGTTVAVYEAVVYGKPLFERTVTVSGPNVPKPGNYMVRIGTPVGHILEYCGVTSTNNSTVILGGPMTGRAQYSLRAPIIKNTTGTLLLPKDMVRASEAFEHCVRCGKCVERCPMRLYPNQLSIFAETEDYDSLRAWNVMDCIECGICVYSCPSNRPILEFIRYAKPIVKKMELAHRSN